MSFMPMNTPVDRERVEQIKNEDIDPTAGNVV